MRRSHERNVAHVQPDSPPIKLRASKLTARIISLTLCVTLILTSTPQARQQSVSSARNKPAQSRPLPPYRDLPNISTLLDEGKNPKPAKPQPALRPPTLCGYRDVVCKRIKEKKDKAQKVGQQLPSGQPGREPLSAHAGAPRGGWLRRLSRAVTGVFSGSTVFSPAGHSLLAASGAGASLPNGTAGGALAVATPPNFISLDEAKLDPRYRTGGDGEDLFSGNYHWSLPLVSLPGRNGLDLNITLHYNSLVWIKHSGNIISFDYDYYPTLTPGFRLGFPEISGPATTIGGFETYIVILPTGRRVALRKVTTNRYEAIDSSYLYLVASPSTQTMTLYATDGTQFRYTIPGGDWWYRCTQVKDRNGNFLTISYANVGAVADPLFAPGTITDTLGRVINLNYQNQRLLSITQAWNGQTYTWAQFDYSLPGQEHPMTPNFGSLQVDGPSGGQQIPVITRIITGDGARHTFGYNEWGQAKEIWRYGEADNQRAALVYAFPSNSAPQSDCPRFTQSNDGIAGWAGQSYVNGLGWVSSYFYFEPNESYGEVTTPAGVTHREYFNTTVSSGRRGLPTTMETWAGGVKKKWTTTSWASDNTSSPPLRPRVTETNVYDDSGARRRTTIEYTISAATVRLPYIVREYNADATTVYRSTQTSYVTSASYTAYNRRIIGLPEMTYLYQGDVESGGTLVAQTGYAYDSPNDTITYLQAHSSTPSQHDSASYGAGFLSRGNLTRVTRYRVTNGAAGSCPSNCTETKTGYYITGNVALTKDALGHQTSFYYDDAFSNGVAPNPATWAYPTRVTDPDGYSSAVKYHYDHSAVTEAIDPKNYAASPTSPPVKTVNTYDAKGRLERAAIWQNNAEYSYTRYVYGTDHNSTQIWTKVETTSDETYVLSLLDGASRERITISEHPGSAGLLKSQYVVFDLAGRVSEWSNPTEIYGQAGCGQPGQTVCWTPWGDDATGYKYSTQTYDWNGRPLLTTNQDLTTRSVSYTGCGCAGGDVTEFQSEIVNGATGRRRTKLYRDSFSREVKTETLDWNGSVYSATTTDYNVRDQVTFGRAYQGDAASGIYQETKLEYDGYSRLWRRWQPIYKPLPTDLAGVSEYDEYEYLDNDLLKKQTDPRGASITYDYNHRDLVTAITYGVTGNVAATPNVTFGYDQAGNRVWLDDGPGWIEYQYDALSQLDWEKRHFDDLGDYQLSYEYNLAGQVKKITDPWDHSISYAYNKAGEVATVTGDGYADINQWTNRTVSNFATGIKYRAWGSIKEFANGNFDTAKSAFAMQFDPRLRLTRFEGSGRITEHDYDNDGRVSEVRSPNNTDYKRNYTYDDVGRLKTASALKLPGMENDPYSLTYNFNAWGDSISRSGSQWGTQLPAFNASWSNGRNTANTHDAAGNVTTYGSTQSGYPTVGYDAEGQSSWNLRDNGTQTIKDERFYGGDGRVAKLFNRYVTYNSQSDPHLLQYFVRSSVLGGQVVAEVKISSYPNYPVQTETSSYVYLSGERIAYQKNAHLTGANKEVVWVYREPVVGSLYATNKLNLNGQPTEWLHGWMYSGPLGENATIPPVNVPLPNPLDQPRTVSMENYNTNCYIDGVPAPCDLAMKLLNAGVGAQVPEDQYTSVYNPKTRQYELAKFMVDWDNGYSGFVPLGATYGGDGTWSWGSSRPKLNPLGTYESKHGRGFSPEPESESRRFSGRLQQFSPDHTRITLPWVVSNVNKLEQLVGSNNHEGYKDNEGIYQCATLPQAWENEQQDFVTRQMTKTDRLTANWKMGSELVYGASLAKGTVCATFNREQGKYISRNAGEGGENHTIIFLKWEERNGIKGMMVIEQRSGPPSIGFIPFDNRNSYSINAFRFNVVNIRNPLLIYSSVP